ncbi:MAG: hypothetical protein LIO58_06185, partial [Oscillospiraceae bacterium]|nr:hypothetical protein [Oscillospiraceae bacterium]
RTAPGATASYEARPAVIPAPQPLVLIAERPDKGGSDGKSGLVLAERQGTILKIQLLLMSCRVMTRGIGSALLGWLINYAQENGLTLQADFISTARNRIMYITYKLMQFEERSRDGDRCLLQYNGGSRDLPDYLNMHVSI